MVVTSVRRVVRSLTRGDAAPESASEPASGLTHRLRRGAGRVMVDSFFRGAAGLGRRLPAARPRRHGVEVIRDVPYADSGHPQHRLDVYRPAGHDPAGPPLPAVLYVHGGGFRILSKDTHWLFGLAYARRGFVVFNVSYRLAPQHRYPAALQDVLDAYRWVVEHAPAYGADVSRLVLAGESAGANLVTSATVAATFAREEPWARAVFETGVVPAAVVAACGILQVSDTERFGRRRRLAPFIADRLAEVSEAYLGPGGSGPAAAGLPSHDLADPLRVLESDTEPARTIPPFFVPVGTKDPLLDDTRRLAAALRGRGVPCRDAYYEGGVHAFHAFVFQGIARKCWTDTFDFLGQTVPAGGPRRPESPRP